MLQISQDPIMATNDSQTMWGVEDGTGTSE